MAHANPNLPPVLVGISGGIAAYKIATVLKHLRDKADVYVVMTDHATKLVGPATFANLTGHPVLTDLWDGSAHGNPVHIDVADIARCLLIAPATANVIGKLANGIADDALTTVAISVDCPILVAPAMNVRMFRHPIVQDNLAKLRRFGYHIIEPDSGFQACGHVGPGRLADEARIADAVMAAIDGRLSPIVAERYIPPTAPLPAQNADRPASRAAKDIASEVAPGVEYEVANEPPPEPKPTATPERFPSETHVHFDSGE